MVMTKSGEEDLEMAKSDPVLSILLWQSPLAATAFPREEECRESRTNHLPDVR